MFSNTCFFLVLVLGLAHVIQPFPVQKDSIIYHMRNDLISPLGKCSFPPADVLSMILNGQEEERFPFLEKCNIKPTRNDGDLLLCMTLYDIGLQMCTHNERNPTDQITRFLPHNSSEFQLLLEKGLKSDPPTEVCQQLQSVLEEPAFPQTMNWNLKHTFSTRSDSCDRICYDFEHEEKMLCKLILWGSNLLKKYKPDGDNQTRTQEELITNPMQSMSAVPVSADGNIANIPSAEHDQVQSGRLTEAQSNERNIPEVPSTNAQNESKHKVDSSSTVKLSSTLAADASSNSQDRVSKKQHTKVSMADSGSEVGRESSSSVKQHTTESKSNKDDLGLDKSSKQQEERKTITSPIAGQSQEAPPEVNAVPKSESEVVNIDSSIRKHPSSASSTVRPAIDETQGIISENTPQLPVDPNIQDNEQGIDGQDFGNDGSIVSDDGEEDQTRNNVVVEPPEKSDIGNDHSRQDPDEMSNNGNAYVRDKFDESEESHFFSYFTTMVLFCIVGYLVFHNKQKILALVLEGRSRRNNRRRPNTANYHKLDCNLEEAVSSPCNTSSTHVIY